MNLNQTLQEKYPHLEVSVLALSEVQKDNESFRIESFYFLKKYFDIENKIQKIGFKYLDEISIKVTDGTHYTPTYTDKGVIFLSSLNIGENYLNLESGYKYISGDEHKKLSKRCLPQEYDILLRKVGGENIYACVVPKLEFEFSIFVSIALVRINANLFSPYFVSTFINSKYGRQQLIRQAKGIAQLDLHLEDLRKLKIPILPMEFQLEIEKMVKDSHKALEESKELYKKAEEMLYLELGIDPKNPLQSLLDSKTNNPTKSPNISIRTLKESFLKTGRLDSEYYQSKYEDIEKFIKSYPNGYDSFSNIISNKDSNFTPKNNENYNYIELANIGNNGNINAPISDLGKNLPTRARRMVSKGDIIISSIEGSLSSCALITQEFDKHLVSTGFFVLNSKLLNGETLLVMFKSQIFQEYLKKFPSGTILCAINKEELSNILIPKIDSITQEKIANHIRKSFKLRTEAKALLEDAKAQVEFAINRGGGINNFAN
ncbi:restriction endonuclease subunit S [Campylobacter armoricus]|uniref:restriction endonuclease subunit S n=1 Tax=Campylobacter armoricus TaxID=2505970 RepID=UPI0011173828|nr:restriction endonuclease subunit S [Campylobacter armoricus]